MPSLPISKTITYFNTNEPIINLSSTETKNLIKAQFNKGFQLEDFIKVIDIKTAEWMNDPVWCNYLRPETLFGTKFESYINQKSVKKTKTYNEEDFDLD